MSLIDKQIGKVDLTGFLGEKLEEAFLQSERDVQRALGKQEAYKNGREKVELLLLHIDKEFESGKLQVLNLEPLQILGLLKKQILRASDCLENLQLKSTSEEIFCRGVVKAYETQLDVIQKLHNDSCTSVKQMQAAMEADPGDDSERKPGEPSHKKMSIEELRIQADEEEAKLKSELETSSKDKPPAVPKKEAKTPKKPLSSLREANKKEVQLENMSPEQLEATVKELDKG